MFCYCARMNLTDYCKHRRNIAPTRGYDWLAVHQSAWPNQMYLHDVPIKCTNQMYLHDIFFNMSVRFVRWLRKVTYLWSAVVHIVNDLIQIFNLVHWKYRSLNVILTWSHDYSWLWYHGVMTIYGIMVLWYYGIMVLWYHWYYGSMVLWYYGIMVLWYHWYYGSMVLWLWYNF